MSGTRGAVVVSMTVLGVVLSSCGGAERQSDTAGPLAGATSSASQSEEAGALPGGTEDGSGQSADQTGTGPSGNGGPAPQPAPGNQPPPPAPGNGGPAPQPAPGSPAPPPPNPGNGDPAPQPAPGKGRPGGEPGGGSSSASRPGGAPPDADIIDELGGVASFSLFKAHQLERCGEFPNCVEVRLDTAGATEDWCALDTKPPSGTKLTEVIEKHDGVILVSAAPPEVDADGKPLQCDGSPAPEP